LIIFGPPGAGKGTQAAFIVKRYRLAHLSSGDILRRELKNGTLGKKIKAYQDGGRLAPNALVIAMIERVMKRKIKGAGFIFDGYPRTLRQAKALDKFFQTHKTSLNLVLNLKLREKDARDRLLARGRDTGRSDDNAETIKKRFSVYRRQTRPLLKYYRARKKVIDLDGRPAIEKIARTIRAILAEKLT